MAYKSLILAALLFLTCTTYAQTTQRWVPGWDNLSEPLNLTRSSITWSTPTSSNSLTVTFKLVGATPNKLYQVGVHIFCTTFPATFGQFPTATLAGGACDPITKQGVTKAVASVEFGVVTTDIHGNGSFKITVSGITAGTYDLEFDARDGAGCNLTGGAGNGSDCAVDFQSPGPTFGTPTTITVP
jgi:hypothetical protein